MTTPYYKSKKSGYTLIELMISVGLFALVMTLAAGAYLIMIGISRQAQGITAGIDNLSFALDTMTRTIRTGTGYGCPLTPTNCSGGDTFSVESSGGHEVSYSVDGNGAITQTTDGVSIELTDPSSVKIPSGSGPNGGLLFYSTGVAPGDAQQARVTIVIKGTVTSGVDKTKPVSFTVETSATMRGSDI